MTGSEDVYLPPHRPFELRKSKKILRCSQAERAQKYSNWRGVIGGDRAILGDGYRTSIKPCVGVAVYSTLPPLSSDVEADS